MMNPITLRIDPTTAKAAKDVSRNVIVVAIAMGALARVGVRRKV